MDDLISRQAAIDAMRQHAHFDDFDVSVVDEDIAITALKELPSAQRWIPCSKKLPDKDGLYLVTTSKEQVQMHVFNHNGNSEEYWMRCNKAWQPLPEPYELVK